MEIDDNLYSRMTVRDTLQGCLIRYLKHRLYGIQNPGDNPDVLGLADSIKREKTGADIMSEIISDEKLKECISGTPEDILDCIISLHDKQQVDILESYGKKITPEGKIKRIRRFWKFKF